MWTSLLTPLLAVGMARAQVTAAGANGVTNPDKPEFLPIGAQVNMTSYSRLLTLNSVDDFCLYGPPEAGPDSLIGNTEPIVVAWCTKPRNNARLIPDGAIHAAHFIKTPLYVQISGFWDGTKVNIPYGDSGGELDPHGAKNLGNPIGGNVTTDVATGSDVFYEEWMSFISYDQFCLRICTAETNNVTAALQCEHELDIMGCRWVMAIDDFYRSNGTFTSCEGEAAAPPGLYPQADGSTSTFRQRYTGTWSADGSLGVFTVGQTVTPSAPAFWPATSNCVTYSTIGNGVATTDYMVTAAPVTFVSGSSATVTGLSTTTMATVTTPTNIVESTSTAAEATDAASTDGSKSGEAGSSAGAATTSSGSSSSAGVSASSSFGAVAVVAGALLGAAVIF